MWRKRLALAGLAALGLLGIAAAAERHNVGRPITPEELAGWDIDVRPDGAGLPPGKGSVKEGQQVYANTCAVCHGDKGEGKRVEGAWDLSPVGQYATPSRTLTATGSQSAHLGHTRLLSEPITARSRWPRLRARPPPGAADRRRTRPHDPPSARRARP